MMREEISHGQTPPGAADLFENKGMGHHLSGESRDATVHIRSTFSIEIGGFEQHVSCVWSALLSVLLYKEYKNH